MTIQEKIVEILLSHCPDLKIEEKDCLVELAALGVDSLDYSAILLSIEEEFGVKFADADMPRLSSVDGIKNYLAANKNPQR